MSSAFTPKEWAYLEAHKHDSRVSEIHWVYSVPIAAAFTSTALRLWAKRAGRNGITLDDYLIVLATICLIGECASGLGYGPPHGMGRHINAVSKEDQTMVRKGDYVFSHFYDIALATVKLAILAFYYRVFAVPVFRKVVIATAVFVFCWGIGITVTLGIICHPIQAFWDLEVMGKCIDLTTFTYFTNISNLITDFWIFLMPVPVIWHLQLQTKKKLLLSLIFCIGLGTCVVSSVRLTVVLGHASPDFTWTFVPLGAYSVFEPLGGILCTNLPIIWHMWRKRRGPLLPGSSQFKSPHTSTATPGSNSRAGRFRRGLQSLGLSTHEQTGTDSQSRTILGDDDNGSNRWVPVDSVVGSEKDSRTVAQPRPAQFWNRVEAKGAAPVQMEEMGEGSGNQIMVERQVTTEVQPSDGKRFSWGRRISGIKTPSGMKKNVWEVRKK
jgi:hypothetical protein